MKVIAIKTKPILTKIDIERLIMINKKAIENAWTFDKSPRAMGRFFLTGWSISLSISTMSLIKYEADDKRQKIIKANKLFEKI